MVEAVPLPPAPGSAPGPGPTDVALRAARLGTYVWDVGSGRLDVDAPLRDLLAAGPGAAHADDVVEHVHPADRAALRAAVTDVLEGRAASLDHQCRYVLPGGGVRRLHCFGAVTQDGDRRLLAGVVQDVTGHRAGPQREAADRAAREARLAAVTSRRRLELLARAAALLDAPPDLEATLRQVAGLAVPELADWCAVDLGSGDGRPRVVAVAHRDPAMVALAHEMQQRWPAPEDDPVRRTVLRTLVPAHHPEITDAMLGAAAQDAEHLAVLRGLGMSSAVLVPLQAGGRAFGAMLLVATGGRRLGPDDVDLALELGRRAGAAIEKVQLVEGQTAQARELRLSEARYRTLVEASSLGVFRADPSGLVTNDIPAWHRLTGRGTTGWDWLESVHPDDREATRAAWLGAIARREPYEATYRLLTRSRAPEWIHARAFPLRADPDDPSSPVLEWVGTVSDVTDVMLARRRSEAVRDSAEALARALDVDEVVHTLHHVAATALDAHSSAVALRHGGTVVVDQFGHLGVPARSTETEDVEGHWPLLHRALTTGRSLYVRDPAELTVLTDGTPAAQRMVPLALAEGEVSWALLPLRYGGTLLGAVRFGWTEPQEFGPLERDTLQAIAAQHAAALVRARLYDAERETSLTLQAALAPRVPSTVNGLEIAMHYRPAGERAQVGGDWVDALALPDGRVCLVVGDVMGSGIPAAATMGRLRTALTALALHEHDPAELLRDLDAMLLTDDLLATVALAVVDPAGGVLDLYSAGHLPILVTGAAGPEAGRPRLVEPRQMPPVGVGWSLDGDRPRPARVAVGPGSVVALCTDGLVETREAAIDVRLAAWRDEVERQLPLGSLTASAQDLVAAMDVPSDDDVTLLLARLPSG